MHEVMKSVLFESQTSQPIHLYPSNVGLGEANDSITINQTDICENTEGAWECQDSHVCKVFIFVIPNYCSAATNLGEFRQSEIC